MNRKKRIGAMLLLFLFGMAGTVSASAPAGASDTSYEYTSRDESVEAPAGYVARKTYTGEDMGVGSLTSPQDFFVAADGDCYILDSGNGRIVVLDADFRFEREIRSLTYGEQTLTFTGARGMYWDAENTLYLADTENKRVVVADAEGRVQAVIQKPESDLIPESAEFTVTKVLHDSNGITYVLVDGISDGALAFDEEYTFIGFYGTNRVEITAEVLSEYLWSKFMTRDMIAASMGRTPASFSSFDIDGKQFIYTVTGTGDTESNFRKLNFKGLDLLETKVYGDLETDPTQPEKSATSLIDVEVDAQGFISVLDQTKGRVFQYSPSGELITIFGGLGWKTGCFQNPVALESYDGKIYALDAARNRVTVFEPTAYALAKRQAILLFDAGEYDASVEYWNAILRMNSNCETAYAGIGKACEENGEYKKAMEYYRLGNDKEGFSTAYREVRKVQLKKYFPLIFVVLIAAVTGLFLALVKHKRKAASETINVSSRITVTGAPGYMLFHPVDCCEEVLKRRKKGSYGIGLAVLACLFVVLSLSWFLTGFLFNNHQPKDYKLLITVAQAFGIFLTWCVANWAVCTLIEGKGSFKEIFCMTAYALMPFVTSLFIRLLLSEVLTLSESGFMDLVVTLGLLWSGLLLLAGLSAIHQFSFGKTILSVLLTLICITIMLFLLTLFYGLVQQLMSFIELLYSEIQMMQ